MGVSSGHVAGKTATTSRTGSAPRRKSPQTANAPLPPDRSHTHAKIEECPGPDPGLFLSTMRFAPTVAVGKWSVWSALQRHYFQEKRLSESILSSTPAPFFGR